MQPFNFVDLSKIELFEIELFIDLNVYKKKRWLIEVLVIIHIDLIYMYKSFKSNIYILKKGFDIK